MLGEARAPLLPKCRRRLRDHVEALRGIRAKIERILLVGAPVETVLPHARRIAVVDDAAGAWLGKIGEVVPRRLLQRQSAPRTRGLDVELDEDRRSDVDLLRNPVWA